MRDYERQMKEIRKNLAQFNLDVENLTTVNNKKKKGVKALESRRSTVSKTSDTKSRQNTSLKKSSSNNLQSSRLSYKKFGNLKE